MLSSLLNSHHIIIVVPQVGRRQWERVLQMVGRIRKLDMEVRVHLSSLPWLQFRLPFPLLILIKLHFQLANNNFRRQLAGPSSARVVHAELQVLWRNGP